MLAPFVLPAVGALSLASRSNLTMERDCFHMFIWNLEYVLSLLGFLALINLSWSNCAGCILIGLALHMHILYGSLLFTGKFVFDDVWIEGFEYECPPTNIRHERNTPGLVIVRTRFLTGGYSFARVLFYQCVVGLTSYLLGVRD